MTFLLFRRWLQVCCFYTYDQASAKNTLFLAIKLVLVVISTPHTPQSEPLEVNESFVNEVPKINSQGTTKMVETHVHVVGFNFRHF